jgi:hypothetical protein
MFTGTNANLAPQRRHQRALRSRSLIIVSTLLVFIACAPAAFGQMGYSVTYSDTWVDSSSTSMGYVVGSGITTDSYNTYNHRYWVKPTITSPSGRTATGTSYTSSSYARLDVSLSWDYRTDFGLYTISTTHSMTCPYIFGVVSSTTGTGITVGASTVVFQNSGTRDSSNRCIMNLISPCNVVCTGRGQTNDPACPNYAIWIEPWYRFGQGNYICMGFFGLDKRIISEFRQECRQDPQ